MNIEPANVQAPGRPLIFVAEDDPSMRQLLEMTIKRAAFEPRLFENAESTVAALQSGGPKPDLLLTDYQMPGMNGLELVAHCRRLSPATKIISISGTPELPELARPECQPDRLLAKPFVPSELIAAMHALLLGQ